MNYLHQQQSHFFSPEISLQELINKLSQSCRGIAIKNRSLIINEVPREINIIKKSNKIIPIITELLETVTANSRNSQIHITAERFRNVVILQIQDRNNYNGYALGFSVQSIEPEAASAGGYIQFKGQQQKIATISLSFPND